PERWIRGGIHRENRMADFISVHLIPLDSLRTCQYPDSLFSFVFQGKPGSTFPWQTLESREPNGHRSTDMTIKIGDKLPSATFKEQSADGPVATTTDALFGVK